MANPSLACVPGNRYGLTLAIASGPVAGPDVNPICCSSGTSGTFLLLATTLRSTSGPVERTFLGPHMKTSL